MTETDAKGLISFLDLLGYDSPADCQTDGLRACAVCGREKTRS